jgi:hypothetical protein
MNAVLKPVSDLLYAIDGQFDDIVLIGPVNEGFRMNGHFGGTVTHGELAGAKMTGVDYFLLRHDGVGVVRAHEVITHQDRVIAVQLHGLLLPPQGITAPRPEDMTKPGFAWPAAPYSIHVSASFETAAPALAHLNRTVVAHSGTVNFATGKLAIEARRIG